MLGISHSAVKFTGDAIHFPDEGSENEGFQSEVRVGELLDALVARQPGPEQPDDPGPRPEEPVTTPPTPETPGIGDPNLPPSDPDPDPAPGPDPAPLKDPGYSV
jgi:hypothetical protein